MEVKKMAKYFIFNAVLCCVFLVSGGGLAFGIPLMDTSSLVRGINIGTGTPEIRIMEPRTVIAESNGVPTSFKFFFDVYLPGTGLSDATKICSTTPKAIPYPSLTNCIPGSLGFATDPGRFFGSWGGHRVLAILMLHVECTDATSSAKIEKDATFIYSAAVDQLNAGAYVGTVWTRNYPRKTIGASSLDLNQDGSSEILMINLAIPISGGENNRAVLIDFTSGTIIKDQTFPLYHEINQ
jgi:hypothetical protein